MENAAKAHVDGEDFRGSSHVYPELAAAGLWTTPTDLATFAIAIQRSVRGDEDSLIELATAREMLTPVLGDAAMGLFRTVKRDEEYFGHGGGNFGFRCQLMFHAEKGYGAVVMTNASRGGLVADEVLNAIANVYAMPSPRLCLAPSFATRGRIISTTHFCPVTVAVAVTAESSFVILSCRK